MVLVEGVDGVSRDGALLREARYGAARNRDQWGVSVKTVGQAQEAGAAGSSARGGRTTGVRIGCEMSHQGPRRMYMMRG